MLDRSVHRVFILPEDWIPYFVRLCIYIYIHILLHHTPPWRSFCHRDATGLDHHAAGVGWSHSDILREKWWKWLVPETTQSRHAVILPKISRNLEWLCFHFCTSLQTGGPQKLSIPRLTKESPTVSTEDHLRFQGLDAQALESQRSHRDDCVAARLCSCRLEALINKC